jgi:3-methyladenine DNA glycosylase AlkD
MHCAIMTKSDVMALLKANQNRRGVEHWKKLGAGAGGLKSYGIGLTQLRKLAKQIGRDHRLARQLWNTDSYDAKVVGLLIDEPAKMTRKQAQEQVAEVGAGMLSHVFSSCDATLPKAPFAFELAQAWIQSQRELERRCGYGLVYELSKDKRKPQLTDAFFLECIQKIRKDLSTEATWVRTAMGGALIGIGKRNKTLHRAAVKVAKEIGPIEYGESSCEPLDVLKHLTSDYLKTKLGA